MQFPSTSQSNGIPSQQPLFVQQPKQQPSFGTYQNALINPNFRNFFPSNFIQNPQPQISFNNLYTQNWLNPCINFFDSSPVCLKQVF